MRIPSAFSDAAWAMLALAGPLFVFWAVMTLTLMLGR